MINYTFSRTALLVLLGLVVIQYLFHKQVVIVALSCAAMFLLWRLAALMREQREMARATREAYVAENPSCNINGKLACNDCGSERVGAQTERKHSNFWVYFCQQCGKALFFTRK